MKILALVIKKLRLYEASRWYDEDYAYYMYS